MNIKHVVILLVTGIICIGCALTFFGSGQGIASTIAETKSIEASTELTEEQTMQELVGLLRDMVEDDQELLRLLLEPQEQDNTALYLVVGLVVLLTLMVCAAILALVVIVMAMMLRPRQERQQVSLLDYDRPALGAPWQMTIPDTRKSKNESVPVIIIEGR